jgi:hypothetical protein
MVGTETRDPIARDVAPLSAVVWIDDSKAIVATMSDDGRVSTCEFERGWLPEVAYLAQVVRVIGDRERVAILGPSSMRLLLEREYVTVFHRPDRLVDVEPAGPVPADELVERVRALAT